MRSGGGLNASLMSTTRRCTGCVTRVFYIGYTGGLPVFYPIVINFNTEERSNSAHSPHSSLTTLGILAPSSLPTHGISSLEPRVSLTVDHRRAARLACREDSRVYPGWYSRVYTGWYTRVYSRGVYYAQRLPLLREGSVLCAEAPTLHPRRGIMLKRLSPLLHRNLKKEEKRR